MESLHYLLMKTHTILNRQILNCAGKVGLTAGQPKVLEFLSQHGESDQKTIASYCEIEPATVGSILLRMERSGLVVRRQHEGNRRSLFVSLTEQGEQAAAAVAEIFPQFIRRRRIRFPRFFHFISNQKRSEEMKRDEKR